MQGGRLKADTTSVSSTLRCTMLTLLTQQAERVLRELEAVGASDVARQFPKIAADTRFHRDQVEQGLSVIRSKDRRIACVAAKGTGKSSLIAACTKAWTSEDGPESGSSRQKINSESILPLGNGGTTPCEVQVCRGHWKIEVEPADLAEVQASLTQFAQFGFEAAARDAHPTPARDSAEPESFDDAEDTPAPEPEMQRLLAGLANLPEGKSPKERLVTLARSFSGTKAEFVDQLIRQANLPQRVRTEYLPDPGDSKPASTLRKILRDLFSGKFADQPLPRRVNLFAPHVPLINQQSIPFIDTLGLPAIAASRAGGGRDDNASVCGEREDIRQLLKDRATLTVCVTSFPNAPAPGHEIIRELAEEVSLFRETLEDRVCIVIMDAGVAGCSEDYDSAEAERAAKVEYCINQLVQMSTSSGRVPIDANEWAQRVHCVNILDNIEETRQFFGARIAAMAEKQEGRLKEAVAAAKVFMAHLGDARKQEKIRMIGEAFTAQIQPSIKESHSRTRALLANILRPLADECEKIHASSLRSIIVRRGIGKSKSLWALHESALSRALNERAWPILNATEQARQILRADARFRDAESGEIIDACAHQNSTMVLESVRTLTEALVRGSIERLTDSEEPWRSCDLEWGNGVREPRYRKRVANHFVAWGETHFFDPTDAVFTETAVSAPVRMLLPDERESGLLSRF